MPKTPAQVFATYLDNGSKHIDRTMRQILPTSQTSPNSLHAAMRYTALSDGKRLRPVLVVLAFEASGGRGRKADPVGAALEFVHAFSLIHDDLPCMDDDDYRRGQPSSHKVFGEGVAILAGDALLTLAFECLGGLGTSLGPKVASDLVLELATATGSRGVVGGQVLDLESEGKQVSLRTVQQIHQKKTARLFQCALRLGGLCAKAKPGLLNHLTRLGDTVGTAFQIVDDILGEVGTQETLGRKPGGDALLKKATYPRVQGIESSQKAVSKLLKRAQNEVEQIPSKHLLFQGFIDMLDFRRRNSRGDLLQ